MRVTLEYADIVAACHEWADSHGIKLGELKEVRVVMNDKIYRVKDVAIEFRAAPKGQGPYREPGHE